MFHSVQHGVQANSTFTPPALEGCRRAWNYSIKLNILWTVAIKIHCAVLSSYPKWFILSVQVMKETKENGVLISPGLEFKLGTLIVCEAFFFFHVTKASKSIMWIKRVALNLEKHIFTSNSLKSRFSWFLRIFVTRKTKNGPRQSACLQTSGPTVPSKSTKAEEIANQTNFKSARSNCAHQPPTYVYL